MATFVAAPAFTLVTPIPNTFGFGQSVAIDGDTLAVGAPGFAANGIQLGGVAIYTRAGGTWVLQQTVASLVGHGGDAGLVSHRRAGGGAAARPGCSPPASPTLSGSVVNGTAR